METNEMNNKPACPKTWLVESILVTIFCCLPLGIVGIVYASKVSSLYASGKYDEAQHASAEAGKWTKIGGIIGLVVYIVYILLMALGVFASASMAY